MAIQVESPQNSCAKSPKVQEEFAAPKAECPDGGTALNIPAAGPAPSPAAPAPGAPAGFWQLIERQCRANRFDVLSRNLFAGGLAALIFLALSTFFSWLSLSTRFGNFQIAASVAGIQTGMGVMIFLLSLAAGGFAAFAFFQKPEWFPLGVRVAAGWGGLTSLYLLVQIFRAGSFAGFGLYLGVLAALAAAATLGFLAVRQWKQQQVRE
jgi:hypothetical protein